MSAKSNAYVSGRKGQAPVAVEKSSIIFWVLHVFVVAFLFWAPFQRALFNGGTSDFERPIYSGLVWTALILFLTAIFSFFVFRVQNQKDVLTALVLLMPLTYTISLAAAASHYLATNMVYIQLLYAAFFILGVFLTKNKIGTSIVGGTLMVSGYVVVLFGLLHWLGNGKVADAIVGWFALIDPASHNYRDAVMTDSNGLRLTAVFQYANTYAAFLIALMLAGLFFIVKSRKWSSVLPHALMLVPIIVSFWLTLSRGAIVIIPVVFLVMLFFMSIQRQIVSIVQLGLAFAASLVILNKVTNAGEQVQKQASAALSWQGWSALLIASIVFAVVAIAIQLFLPQLLDRVTVRFNGRKYATFILPVVAIVVGILGAVLLFGDTGLKNILPANVKTRIENINFEQHSVLERETFYRDAIKLWKDYPIIGAGGGAWAALYEKYQNNPYTSRQAHNFALQYLVESGALGFLAFVAFLVAIFYFYIRSFIRSSVEKRDEHFLFFIITIALLAHSMIDFDLSYVYLGAVLFLCLGVMLSGSESAPIRIRSDSLALHKAFPGMLLVLSVVLFVISTRLLAANNSFQQAVALTKTSQNYNEIIAPLDQAIKLHPNHPDYVLTGQTPDGRTFSKISLLIQMYNQTKNEQYFTDAQNLLSSLEKAEPHNRLVVYQQLNFLQVKGKLPEALAWATQQLPNYPWYIDLYESKITLSVELGNQARTKGDMKTTDTYFTEAVNTYNKILQQIDSLKNLPKGQEQGRPFEVSPTIAVNIGEVDYMRGDYAAASALMKAHLSGNMDDQLNKTLARWYLAALQKQGQNDQAVYNQLIAKDPKEKDNIAAIVATNYAVK
jgi:O-antigen ligase